VSDIVLVQKLLHNSCWNSEWRLWLKGFGQFQFSAILSCNKAMFCGVNRIFPCSLFTVIGFVEIWMTSVCNIGHVLFVTAYNAHFSR
jgi:hypothetical protein